MSCVALCPVKSLHIFFTPFPIPAPPLCVLCHVSVVTARNERVTPPRYAESASVSTDADATAAAAAAAALVAGSSATAKALPRGYNDCANVTTASVKGAAAKCVRRCCTRHNDHSETRSDTAATRAYDTTQHDTRHVTCTSSATCSYDTSRH